MFEAKIENPITIRILGKVTSLIVDGEEFEFNKYIALGGNHFGFKLITYQNGNQVLRTYPTHTPVWKVQCLNIGFMQVHETDKNAPWFFKQNGEYIKCALFSKHYLPDREVVQKHTECDDVVKAMVEANGDLLFKVEQVNKQSEKECSQGKLK